MERENVSLVLVFYEAGFNCDPLSLKYKLGKGGAARALPCIPGRRVPYLPIRVKRP